VKRELTINRWHKVVKRLYDLQNKLKEDYNKLTNCELSVYIGEDQKTELEGIKNRGISAFYKAGDVLDLIYKIKLNVSHANKDSGIDDILNKIARIQELIKLYKNLDGIVDIEGLAINEIDKIPNLQENIKPGDDNKNWSFLSRNTNKSKSFKINLIADTLVTNIQNFLNMYKKEEFRLQDELNDKNNTSLEIEFSNKEDEILKEVI